MAGRLRSIVVLATVGLALAGCSTNSSGVDIVRSDPVRSDPIGSDSAGPDSTESTPGESPAEPVVSSDDSFGWVSIGPGLEHGRFEVPFDYDNPAAGSFTLFVGRRQASDPSKRIGTLLVNPGGPGFGGSFMAESAEFYFGQQILDSFDIIGWDPRGTGSTEPTLDCIDDYDPYFSIDSSPDTEQERDDIVATAIEFGQECKARSEAILPFVSTEDTARDMDAMRQALGEGQISYFGFSYGSELGVTWATLFPATVRAMVIDGAADQTVDYLQQNLEQAAGFEGTFETFLSDCSARTQCTFHNDGDAAGAFDRLSAAADAAPVDGPTGRPDITQGVLIQAVADAMYSQSYWPGLERALDDLQNGDGEGILALYDDYYSRQPDGSYDNSLEAYFAINCLDDPGTKDPQVLFDLQDEFAEVAPRIGPSYILELQFCAAWPVPAAPRVGVDAAGAGPIVVVGTTGDPATPLISTRHMADALEDGRLVVVTADQHTGYGLNQCVNDAVDTYLVTLEPPAGETICE